MARADLRRYDGAHIPDNFTMAQDDTTSKLWGGRFTEPTDQFVQRFTASVNFDRRLYRQDIQGSLAHATMLHQAGILDTTELANIQRGLAQIIEEVEQGSFQWSVALEDVHMNVEARLTEIIGITGKKLHTGRSRNDQIATDIRLYMREQIDIICSEITRLQAALAELATREADTIMPGFTHLQTAQPVTYEPEPIGRRGAGGHHLPHQPPPDCRDTGL
jgi:argininosuccinate lyase